MGIIYSNVLYSLRKTINQGNFSKVHFPSTTVHEAIMRFLNFPLISGIQKQKTQTKKSFNNTTSVAAAEAHPRLFSF